MTKRALAQSIIVGIVGLLVIGGLNWGLEFFGWGISSWSFVPSGVASVIYLLVGVSALVEIFTHKKNCKCCETKAPMQTM